MAAEGRSFDMDELQSLAALVNEHGFTDFEFENENIRVKMSKAATVVAAPPMIAAPAAPVQAAAAKPAAASAPEVPVDDDADLHKITSPIVGTFYRAPGPDKPPYVSEGAAVSAETVVCIVEAMKLMNEIQAETSGTIVKIYVQDGQPVEYGQPLFGVKG
ncbi:MAG: acetyl-CoA carboxylase, biotin carboxyl carrier protein [Acidobacteria bacterium OLB17]|nr:MAG: acetyl-CoA carboxylase, biotin carboxyl carrier protein [Acidobacteria bacterium OLB17]